jgi:hypothetical protein
MTRQNLSLGVSANDGTGDNLRSAGTKINQTFVELFLHLGGDSNTLSNKISIDSDMIIFEGRNIDAFETYVRVLEPTADNNIYLPNHSGIVLTDSAAQTLSNKTIISPVITTPQIHDLSSNHQFIFVVPELAADRNVNLPTLTDSDTFVFAAATQTLTGKTLTSPIIITPNITTSINDANGAEVIKTPATSSAINEITITNAATGNGPAITATGGDANIDLDIGAKGTGAVHVTSKLAYSLETLTGNGAVSLLVPLTVFNKGTALAATLADGTVEGEAKVLINKGAGLATVTPTTYSQGTSFALAQKGACDLVWISTFGWTMIGGADSADTYITIT